MKPGDRYTKNGVEFTVHNVEGGQVYGVRYKLPVDDAAVRKALDAGEWPPNCLGPARIDVADFERASVGAEVTPCST